MMGFDGARLGEVAAGDALQDDAEIVVVLRRAAREDDVKRGAEAVDVAGAAELIEPTGGLLGTHEGGGADRGAHLRRGGAGA